MAQKILGPIGEKINIISLFQIVEKIDDHGQRLQCIGGGNQLFYFILFYFSVVVTFAANQSYSLDLFTFLYHTSFLCVSCLWSVLGQFQSPQSIHYGVEEICIVYQHWQEWPFWYMYSVISVIPSQKVCNGRTANVIIQGRSELLFHVFSFSKPAI